MNQKIRKKLWVWVPVVIAFITLVGCSIWLTCRDFCVSQVRQNSNYILSYLLLFSKKVALILLIFILFKLVGFFLINKLLKKVMISLGNKERYKSIQKIVGFIFWTIFFFISLSVLVGDVTALIASLGLVGFGLTFALQKPILNFVGWLTILFKNIYHEGDRIRIGSIIGDVKDIQVMNTLLDGLLESSDVYSGKVISFPNELVLTSDIQNFTKESNYIVNELKISITYESDYHKAIRILKEITVSLLHENGDKYLKKASKRSNKISQIINKWVVSKENKIKIQKLEQEKERVDHDIKVLEEEFKPKIRVEMLDSSIELIAQYKCPYTEIKEYRTRINLAFLDRIRQEKDIEVAYPHLQIIKK